MATPATPHSKPGGKTLTKQATGDVNPRLPHEHDESADSQHSDPRKEIKQAYDDVQSGQEDTDLHGSQGKRQPAARPFTRK